MANKVKPLIKGSEIPDFQTVDDLGEKFSKQNLLGTRYLLYFYPKDNTPGCSNQACGFRDLFQEFKQLNVSILGISGGNQVSHQKFRQKFQLPFPLLIDEDFAIAKKFGVFGEKKFMGKTFQGLHRISFLIGKNGTVESVYDKVKSKTHPFEVLEIISKNLEF